MLNKNRSVFSRLKVKNQCLYKYFSSSSSTGEIDVPFTNGSTLKLSTGRYARFADGACVATLGNTSILSTVVSKTKSASSSFLPLVVDYRQKAAAAGRIPTNYLRKELGPTEREILTSRLIDRSLRPLFPHGYNFDTQIVCNMLAVDSTNPPETIAINAASAALAVSDVPWNGPVGAVRIGHIDNEIVMNPTRKDLEKSTLNLIVAATTGNLVVMLEGFANDILQQDLLKAIKLGTKEAQHIVRSIEKLQKSHGKSKREYETLLPLDQNIVDSIKTLSTMKIREILSDFSHDKTSRDVAISDLRQTVLNQMRDTEADINLLQDCFNSHLRQIFRDMIFETDTRCDGRMLDDLRNISCEVSLYEPLHGSALFQRGQTQVLCTVAFDSLESAMKMDPLTMITSGLKEKSFFLHYEFPSYATGETGRAGSRREAGHGALAERALLPLVPPPRCATRLTAEVLESNGSSSMASVCGGSLALMDAGVELAAPAAGVAIGLVSRPDEQGHIADYRILTDLLGIEDYMGDMDFKVAGTKKGITALQADVKLPGLPLKVVMESVQKACDGKSKIIDIMNKCLDKPRQGRKENMPVLEEMEVEVHKRAKLLGVGGINLKRLYVETGVQITPIDETRYSVFAPSQAAMDEARARIDAALTADRAPELEFGAIYTAKVVEVRDIGVMVTLFPNMAPALVHNSQLDHRKIMHPSVLGLEVGSEIQVKYFGRDPVSGQLRLSKKVLSSPPPAIVRKLDKS
ncbi:polyribonucleotide nucleotidyltransferase 1, mitochondrial [Aricia agestis]|uniref:polyribonucleotide nucleotidyltransferase 1, mitochondrial n=1 Tax=Aricia agestis TaxID=91739 RepID=UPI001C2044BA|nr:polyribonucleotide nucleotidyltransferase 1, mitochondrial [Aricia agestis]XP_041968950.1 polyribonucleotide nucleotidyltransferase 1, mitochondrial [Aricia agestis]